jgi:predicted nucleic acid-binding protein
MRVYLDASVLISLLTNDIFTPRAKTFLRATKPALVLSDFARAEFASAMARRVRTGEIGTADAQKSFGILDAWAARATAQIEILAVDIRSAEVALRRLDLTLRTPDAINIAIAQRAGAHLATFDVKMAAAALVLGADLAAV